MERIYGNTRTSLNLNKLASLVYLVSDPLTITEYDSDNGLRYRLSGIIEADNLTASEVNDMLTEDEILDSLDEYEFYASDKETADSLVKMCDTYKTDSGIDLEHEPYDYIRLADLRGMVKSKEELIKLTNNLQSR